jgi:hypothetical protein
MTTADAHFIRPLKNIEVQVTFQKTRFKAICSAFPECKGFGKSEDEAVNKLCKSISKFISHIARTLVENVIREAVNPPEKIPNTAQKKVSAKSKKQQNAGMPLLSYPEDRQQFRIPPDQDIHTLIERLQGPIEEDLPIHSELDGFYMGFPLSLN